MALRVRFKIGKGESNATFGRSLASAIAEQVAFRAADGTFNKVKEIVATRFQQDAKRELTHTMALYRRHIIGARMSGRPSGMLSFALGPSDTGVGDDDNEIAIASSLPSWAPRSPAYLREKQRKGWPSQWFSARGDLARGMRAETLIQAYGPIRVSVVRDRQATDAAALGNFRGARLNTHLPEGAHIRLKVATIRIFALEAITPAMLPALATGDPSTENNDDPARGRRLLGGLLNAGATGRDVYHSLSRLSYKTHRYRPTMEPFLAWYLTRSIPNALALRLEQGAIRQARRLNVVRR